MVKIISDKTYVALVRNAVPMQKKSFSGDGFDIVWTIYAVSPSLGKIVLSNDDESYYASKHLNVDFNYGIDCCNIGDRIHIREITYKEKPEYGIKKFYNLVRNITLEEKLKDLQK